MAFAGIVGQGAGIRRPDAFTKLLVRGWQPSLGTNAFKEATGKTVTPTSGATLQSTVKKFIGGALQNTTASDTFSIPDSTDFDFGTSDWCIEGWIYVNEDNGTYTLAFFSQDASTPAQVLQLQQTAGTGIFTFRYSNTNNAFAYGTNWDPTLQQWYHVAWVSYGTKWRLYIDGSLLGTEGDLNINGITAPSVFLLFKSSGSTRTWWVYADEVRLTVGSPRYTANFVPPTRRGGIATPV